jgi:hypothetical protein
MNVEVWNRAALLNGGAGPRVGDVALSALLRAHGMVMNGGVFHAVVDALKPADVAAACEGFRFFGFEDVAALFELASKTTPSGQSEVAFNARYARSIGNDSVLTERFARHFAEHPDLYAPLRNEPMAPELARNLEAMQRAALAWKRGRE